MPLPPLSPSASPAARAGHLLTGVACTGGLFSTLFAFNLLQLLSLVLRPFSEPAFRSVNRWAAGTWWRWCAATTTRIHRTRVVWSGDELPGHENALVIANHQSMTDIQALLLLGRRARRLGDMKWFVKKALRFFPGVGWGMWFLDCLFVRRDWSADRERIRATFRSLVDRRVPLWLVSFVEGTRLTPEKLTAARAFARERGLFEPRHVLIPRSRGFAATLSGLEGHLHAVYDVTIGYAEGIPSLWQWVCGRTRELHLDVRRIPVAELPTGTEALTDWLMERFRLKDLRLEQLYAGGALGDPVICAQPPQAAASPR